MLLQTLEDNASDLGQSSNAVVMSVAGLDNIEIADSKNASLDVSFSVPSRILPCIVFSQFCGTSLWFAGNAVLSDFIDELDLPGSSLPILTSAVQAGFIAGTLLLAISNLVDRFLPTHIYLISSVMGAVINALIPSVAKDIVTMTILRFLTGVTLAGIYPVGMKVAADWYQNGLGRALGLLVGALVLGTAFPFLLRQILLSWNVFLYATSILAAFGGVVMVFRTHVGGVCILDVASRCLEIILGALRDVVECVACHICRDFHGCIWLCHGRYPLQTLWVGARSGCFFGCIWRLLPAFTCLLFHFHSRNHPYFLFGMGYDSRFGFPSV
jgi:MFS family permease